MIRLSEISTDLPVNNFKPGFARPERHHAPPCRCLAAQVRVPFAIAMLTRGILPSTPHLLQAGQQALRLPQVVQS
jgi:hypothetical protein